MRESADLQDVASDLSDVNWSMTDLGPVSLWEVRLRTMAGCVLRQTTPACLLWGSSATMIFNVTWRKALGARLAGSLGRSLVALHEELGPIYSTAFASATTACCADLSAALVPMMWRMLADRPGVALSCVAVPGEDGSTKGFLVHRVFDRPHNVKRTSDLPERNEFQLLLSDALRRLNDPGEIQTTGARMLGEMLRADRASFVEIELDAGLCREHYEYRRGDVAPTHVPAHRLNASRRTLEQLRNGMPLVIGDVCAEGDCFDAAALAADQSLFPIRAELVVPVTRGNSVLSLAILRVDSARDWHVDEISLVNKAAVRISEVIERARAESSLRVSEARHRTLFDSIDEGVCLFERLPLRPDGLRDYRYVTMNKAMQVMFGIPDLSSQSMRDNFRGEYEDWYDDYDRVLLSGEPIRMVRESQAQGMVLEMFVTRVEDVGGNMLLAVMQNVTARVRAEEGLRQSELRLRMAQKAAGVATFDWEVGSKFMRWSPEAAGMLGLRPGAFGGTYEDWIDMIYPDDAPHAIEQIEWALEDGDLEGEWRIVRVDGSIIWVLVRGQVERDAEGRPSRLTGAQVDVTDRVRSELDTRSRISDLITQITELRRRLEKKCE